MSTEPAVDPDLDLDTIAADLAAIETVLDELDAGTYRHDDTTDTAPPES